MTLMNEVERLLAEATRGPWELVWWGNEQYPYPLSVNANGGASWVARNGAVSFPGNASLIAAAPDLAKAYLTALDQLEKAREALAPFARAADDFPTGKRAGVIGSSEIVELYRDDDTFRSWCGGRITFGDLRRARAAHEGNE